MKFHENLTSGSQFLPCRWTDREMAKLTDACCNFENVPKKYNISKSITMLGDPTP
jgi:hypothetical protein